MSTDAPAGGDVKAALSHKVGPLPAGVWLLAVAGGLAVAVVVRRRAADAPATTAATDGTGDFGDGLDNTAPGVGNIGSPVASNAAAGDVTAPAIEDNDQWVREAVVKLIAHGYQPLTVSNALNAWMAGEKLTTQQAAIVNEALRVMAGPPPIAPPIPDGGQTNTPTPTPATPAPPKVDKPLSDKPFTPGHATHAPGPIASAPSHPVQSRPGKTPAKPAPAHPAQAAYTVRAGDSLSGIAGKHHTTAGKLYSKNRTVIEKAAQHHGRKTSSSGRYIYPGTVLVLP